VQFTGNILTAPTADEVECTSSHRSVYMPPLDGQRRDGDRWIFLYRKNAFDLAMTLTFDLLP